MVMFFFPIIWIIHTDIIWLIVHLFSPIKSQSSPIKFSPIKFSNSFANIISISKLNMCKSLTSAIEVKCQSYIIDFSNLPEEVFKHWFISIIVQVANKHWAWAILLLKPIPIPGSLPILKTSIPIILVVFILVITSRFRYESTPDTSTFSFFITTISPLMCLTWCIDYNLIREVCSLVHDM